MACTFWRYGQISIVALVALLPTSPLQAHYCIDSEAVLPGISSGPSQLESSAHAMMNAAKRDIERAELNWTKTPIDLRDFTNFAKLNEAQMIRQLEQEGIRVVIANGNSTRAEAPKLVMDNLKYDEGARNFLNSPDYVELQTKYKAALEQKKSPFEINPGLLSIFNDQKSKGVEIQKLAEAFATLKDRSGSFVAKGNFLPGEAGQALGAMSQDTIFIKDFSDRMTLIHERLHAKIAQHRRMTGEKDPWIELGREETALANQEMALLKSGNLSKDAVAELQVKRQEIALTRMKGTLGEELDVHRLLVHKAKDFQFDAEQVQTTLSEHQHYVSMAGEFLQRQRKSLEAIIDDTSLSPGTRQEANRILAANWRTEREELNASKQMGAVQLSKI